LKEPTIRTRYGEEDPLPDRRRLWRYGPPVVWATMIFVGSSDLLSGSHTGAFILGPLHWLLPHASDETLAFIHLAIRKAGHLTEYAILAWLTSRAVRTSSREFLRRQWFWFSLLAVAAYSLSDEFHQMFVPSRGASLHDSMIDTVGGFIGLVLVWLWQRRRKKDETSPADASKATAAA
jgi:VanZ family protein